MEIWAKKYYYFLSKYAKIDTSSKVNIEELAKAYKDAGFDDAVLKICENNKHIEKGVPIAIILQYGHGTGTGGWVEGRDYINPAIRPIFDKIADEAWKEVTRI